MGAGALTICHNRAAIQIKQDMKRMAQLPLLKQRAIGGRKMFGVSLLELKDLGYVGDGVPLVVRSMVEFLKEHALQQEGLFRVNGNVRAVDTLRQRLENGEEVDLLQEGDVCTVASLLKQFLRDLPEGLIPNSLQPALLKQHRVSRDDQFIRDLRGLLLQLPDVHYSLLKYLCHFLTQVEKHQKDNRMTALNLATVFGPNVFHVSLGFDGMLEQNVCNKIMAKLIQNYSDIFESNGEHEDPEDELSEVITVKEASAKKPEVERSPCKSGSGVSTPAPRKKQATCSHPPDYADPSKRSPRESLVSTQREKKAPCSRLADNADPSLELTGENQTSTPRKKKVKKVRSEGAAQTVPLPAQSAGLPQVRTLAPGKVRAEEAVLSSDDVITVRSTEASASFQDDERPISPFYMRSLFSTDHCRADSANVLERTIRSAVEQHLFDVRACGGQSSEDSESATLSSLATTARQRRRQQRDQDEARKHKNTDGVNKENIPSVVLSGVDGARRPSAHGYVQESMRHRPSQLTPTLAELSDNQDSLLTCLCTTRSHDRTRMASMESIDEERRYHQKEQDLALSPTTSTMKIQEVSSSCDMGKAQRSPDADRCDDVPRLDLSTLIEDSHWGDPVPAYPSWQRESMDREEARISPHVGGRLIRQLLEEDSDPMLSPRSYAFGHSQQYLDDPEVPPSPPNAHSFMSRRRSSSLGSCEDDREELTSAQISKKIHSLKRKIHKYEEKFEEERKYRPSHSDKAANPEVLRWMNELSKLRKDLKELKLMKSEEDLPPVTRQRSNTLPKSFGSQLERKPLEKAPKPPVENTLEAVQKKLLEKREEVGRPEDIKDMTREQISAEKVALQKALLHYESIHGRPVTKSERQTMKPLYDRYRLVKQILCRASTIPVIGSPSSKRRGPLLQPIIEGEPALFFDHIKEEEDGSEDDGDAKTQFTMSIKPEFSMLGFLDQLDEEVDGFVSPVDELSPSKNSTDMRLSNLHSATMPELVEQLQEAREEKKRIRKSLREFEDQFFRQNGRSVQKEDRSPLAEEYNEYKHVKAKLRLLEVLISKRGSSKLI